MPLTRLSLRCLAATAATASVLALGGCGEDDASDALQQSGSSSSSTAPSQESGSSSGTMDLEAAGRLVLDRVSGSTLTSIEDDNGGWEVTVADDDGRATDASANYEGTQITRGPTRDDDSDDLAERKRELAAADLDFSEAAAAVTAAEPGVIRELNLDTRDNSRQVVWEADVRNAQGNQVSVSIDAGSGQVVSRSSDDDGGDDD